MAVYTELSDEQMQRVAKAYGFASIVHVTPITEGVENTNYLIAASMPGEESLTRFILTVFEARVALEDVPFYLHLKEVLHGRGIPCPLPRRTEAGERFMMLEGKALAVVSFLEGISVTYPELPHICQGAQMLARMHLAGQDTGLHRANGMSFDAWHYLRARIAERAETREHRAMLALIDAELAFQTQHYPYDLPSGIIHADFFPNNVFFDEAARLCGVIDFYFACTDLFAYDLAILANAWCGAFTRGQAVFSEEAYAALLQAYHGVRPLSEDERAAMPVLLRASALRFLLTRLHDVLYHDEGALLIPHDPQEYVEKLRYHQERS